MQRRSVLVGAAAMLLPFSARASSEKNVVIMWDAVATGRLKYNPQLGPIGDAIMGAGLHRAIYDAWSAYSDKATTSFGDNFRVQPSERTLKNKEEAISYAAYRFLTDRFPDKASLAHFNTLMSALGYDPANMSSSAAEIGNRAGILAVQSRENDGSNYNGKMGAANYADFTGYVPVNEPMEFSNPELVLNPVFKPPTYVFKPPANVFAWQPLKNPAGVVQKYAGPQMGNVTPYCLTKDHVSMFETLLAKPHYLTDLAAYKKECEVNIRYSAGLTEQDKIMVEFWADGPGSKYYPTAHWRFFAAYVAKNQGYDLDMTVKLFFTVATAAADAGIMTWRAKRANNGSRPITGIRTLFQGKQIRAWGGPGHPTELIYGETFSPFNPSDPDLLAAHQSPGFPGWPSGHAMFSGACSRALQLFTGSDAFNFTTVMAAGFGIVEDNLPPQDTRIGFKTFSEAAKSAALSRVLSGIHFQPDCSDDVLKVGRQVGDITWDYARKLFG